MAKRRRRPMQPNTQSKSLSVRDGFINTLAYLGEASELNKANDFERHSITRDTETLTVMYRENWIAKRIIDMPCEDMTRAWYTLASEMEQDKLDELAKLETKHNVKQEITNALRWARLYGGSVAVMVIKGQEDMLDQPLDYDQLMPGSFRGLIVVDRTDGLYPSDELEEDMDDPEFGYPKYYHVNVTDTTNVKVHHSRLLIFRGRLLPIQEEEDEQYWGASELEHVYEELQKRNATSANIAQLIFQANVSALKISDYGEVLAMGTEKQKQRVMEAIYNANRIRNSFGMMLMGAEDNFEQHPYSFAGISEVYESFMMDMAGAAEIPATKLYGRAPQGMNATGESDMNNYYEKLAQLQELQLKPAIEKLLPVMAMSLWGEVPDDMEVVFEPLASTTPAERSEIMSKQGAAVIQAFSAGLISQRTALLELREQGKNIGAWTNITDEDIEKAEDEVDTGEGMGDPMGMMGPGMGPEGMPPDGMMPPEEAPEEAPEEEPEAPQEAPEQPEQLAEDERAEKITELRERIERLKAKAAAEEIEDGGPGSGPRPGYHKNGTSLIERAKFMANPTAGLPEPPRQQRTAANVRQQNRERKEWSDLSLKQKVQGNAAQERHMRKMKSQVMKAAAKGDLKTARAIVKANRHYWANDPDSAQKVQSETLKRQKAVRRGFMHDIVDAFRQMFAGDEFREEEHPRGKGGKFVSKGSGSVSGSTEETKPPVEYAPPKNNQKANKLAEPVEIPENKGEKPLANSPQAEYNNGNGAGFVKTAAKQFRKVFHAAKAAVDKDRPQDSWRVDSTYTDDDYEHMECYTTPGGSAVAVHDGDIVSVCANPNDKTTRGRDLLSHAVEMGGKKLDAFGNLYGFYIKNGFEPASWCEFDEQYAPDGWTKGRDDPEPVIFFKHTGRSRDEIAKDFGNDYHEYVKRVKASADYDAAKEERDKSLKG